MSSPSYQVPTRPVAARLVLSGGLRQEVTFFLPTLSQSHSGPDSLDEFLNEERPFLPVQSRDSGHSLLVSRAAIVVVEAGPEAPVLTRLDERAPSSIDLVRVQMDNGLTVEGALSWGSPPEKPRLSDFFNQRETFIPVEVGEEVLYLNKRHIVCVWL